TSCSGTTNPGAERAVATPARSTTRMTGAPLKNAVVLVSGGMDSAVVLAIAREQGFAVHALSVAYGQRHTSELEAAAVLAANQGAVAHKVVGVDLRAIGGSALTADIDVPEAGSEGIP